MGLTTKKYCLRDCWKLNRGKYTLGYNNEEKKEDVLLKERKIANSV